MKFRLSILALFATRIACAQTPVLVPPAVTMPLPAPVTTVAVGGNVTVTWSAVTTSTTNAALTGPVTYNLWGVETGTAVEENSGITGTSVTHNGMTAGLKCYVVTARVSGDIDSPGSSPPVCVNVVVPTPQVSAPANVTITVSTPTVLAPLTDKACVAADDGCAPAVTP